MINIKRLFFVFTFFVCFFSSSFFYAQKINQFDENKKRTGIWIKYHANNKVRYTGTFEKGKEIGVFKFYDISSSKYPIIVKTYSKKNDAFLVKFYSIGGVLQSRGYYLGRKRIGHWIYYFENGKLRSEEYYKDELNYQKEMNSADGLIKKNISTWDAINPEFVARMKLQNRFQTGLDIAKYTAAIMRKDMKDPIIATHIEDTMVLGQRLRPMTGTPFFMIGDEFFAGANVQRLNAMLETARKG